MFLDEGELDSCAGNSRLLDFVVIFGEGLDIALDLSVALTLELADFVDIPSSFCYCNI